MHLFLSGSGKPWSSSPLPDSRSNGGGGGDCIYSSDPNSIELPKPNRLHFKLDCNMLRVMFVLGLCFFLKRCCRGGHLGRTPTTRLAGYSGSSWLRLAPVGILVIIITNDIAGSTTMNDGPLYNSGSLPAVLVSEETVIILAAPFRPGFI